MKKRLLATLLALVMALGLCVTTAWAEDPTVTTLTQLSDLTKEGDTVNGFYYRLENGTYRLGGNITLDCPIMVFGTVTLDLNGYSISSIAGFSLSIIILQDGSAFTLEDTSGSASGTVNAPRLSDSSLSTHYHSIDLGKSCTFTLNSGTVASVGLSDGSSTTNAIMYADGGTVTGVTRVEKDATIITSPDASGTTFNGSVVNKGTISGGTFNGQVNNYGTISGGVFNGTMTNGAMNHSGTISGGTFYGTVDNTNWGTIEDSAKLTVTFNYNYNGSEPTAEKVLKGQKVAAPADPTREGHTFVGWYTDEDCTAENEYSFDTPVTESLTLYAKWTADAPEVTPTPAPSTRPTTSKPTTATTETVASPKTGDAGVLLSGALALTSLLGMGYVGKKR